MLIIKNKTFVCLFWFTGAMIDWFEGGLWLGGDDLFDRGKVCKADPAELHDGFVEDK